MLLLLDPVFGSQKFGATAGGLRLNFWLNRVTRAIAEDEGPWLAGRGALISVAGEVVGTIGEIDPAVGDSFELRVPIQAGEFDIEALGRLIPDPVL